MALYLAQEVINNAFVDLDSLVHGSSVSSSSIYSKPATTCSLKPGNRKRKHGTTSGDQQIGVSLEVELLKSKPITSISVQIAALQALEALLTVV